ncbi:MAG: thioredoxin family protein [Rubritalea sp.]|jgi:thiol:disulfide interchange protein|tara:strand:+ start:2643 stop:3089 length:447 start_codon:yes stop_codon:yes gene_type:complete
MINLFRNLLLVALMVSGSALAEGPWLTNIEAGVKKAKAEGKLVMVEFTGSDWCPPCMMMDKEVFSKKEFLADAQKSYVLVKLDAPNSNPELKKATQELMKKYKVKAFPFVLLFDAEGKEFKRFAATENRTVEDFIKRLLKEKRRKDML